ncbi:MAG: hypothetical protein ACI80N_003272, partial [Gammaproteobacteria bacterium]
KNNTLLALGALAASTLLAFTLPEDTVSFAPTEGSSLTKTFASVMTFNLDDMNMTMNGESPPMMPEMEMEMTQEMTLVVTDEYASLKDGTVAKLLRSFETIGQEISVETSMEMMGETQETNPTGSGGSALEGTTVSFTWNDDDEEYERAFEGDGDDEELLDGLTADMDLRALLPEGDVSEGDEWDVELVALVDILAPGGDLAIDLEMDGGGAQMGGPDPQMMSNMRELLGDLLEGDFKATYSGTRKADGLTLGVISVTIDIESARDMSEYMSESMDEADSPIPMELDRADVEFMVEAEGELLWDLAAGHLHSFDLKGDASITMDMAMTMDMGEEMSMEMSMEMSGTIAQSVRVTSLD